MSAGVAPDPAAALRTPVFRTLVGGWALTNFADSVLTLILAVWVADLTGNVALAGATFAALGVPALASPLLGQLADRMSRRRLLAWTYLGGAAVLVPLFWVDDARDVWLVYAVTALYSSVAYVTGACQSGLLKDLVPTESLGHANGRLAAIDQVFRLAMPFVGAAVYAWSGPLPLVGATIGAFAASAVVFAACASSSLSPSRRRVGGRSGTRRARALGTCSAPARWAA
jgi:MFS family permease